MKKVTRERLAEIFTYDPEEGVLRWKNKQSKSRAVIGGRAGTTRPDGYVQIVVDRECMLAHRAIWMLIHGHWPEADTDHIDGNRSNNKLSNLRCASRSENRQNTRKSFASSGYVGVYWCKRERLWLAKIQIGDVRKNCGYHKSKELARAAYLQAKAILHPFVGDAHAP